MNAVIERVPGFFIDNFPSWKAIAVGGPLGLAWSFAALGFAGRLKRTGERLPCRHVAEVLAGALDDPPIAWGSAGNRP